MVVVGWNDSTTQVSSVTDTQRKRLSVGGGPNGSDRLGPFSQAIYYANNIAAGANSVMVRFNAGAAYPDIRIMEYSGIDSSNPLDVAAGTTGNSATSSSGSVTTTNATDLLVGAELRVDVRHRIRRRIHPADYH